MTRILVFTILLATCQMSFAQKYLSKIDSLNSNAEVEKLIRSFHKNYKEFSLRPFLNLRADITEMNFAKRLQTH